MIKFNFCPQCKNPLIIKGQYPFCEKCNVTFYRNSKPTAGVLIVKDDQVLLAKRGIEPYKGHFDLVGGFLEYGELPQDGAIREVKEETGLDVELSEILGIYMDQYGTDGDSTLNIEFIGKIIGGEIEAKDDVAELVWVPINQIPRNHGFISTLLALQDLQKKYSK